MFNSWPGFATTYAVNWRGQQQFAVADRDKDGTLDMWSLSRDGEDVFVVKDRNNDHQLDYWWKRTRDRWGVLAEDNDYDGVADKVEMTISTVMGH